MPSPTRTIEHPALFGVTESSVTLVFDVCEDGRPVDAEATIAIDGAPLARSKSPSGTHVVRVEGLAPDAEVEIEIRAEGSARADVGRYFEGRARTLEAPRARQTASFATLNDLHFGESRIGGTLTDDHEYGDAAPGFAVIEDEDYDDPYAEFMNADAVTEINRTGVDATIIKGDIANNGLAEQFEAAARCFEDLEAPHHAFLGNHDHLALREGLEVDGNSILGQEPAPRAFDLGGWRLVLLDTTVPGEHPGAFGADRRAWLADLLEETRRHEQPTLLFTHHHPVPPEHAGSYPNTIGIAPADSVALFELLGHHPQVRGVLIGHTHRNRVRTYGAAGPIPFAEINNPKDYPGGFAHYRLFEDGSFRQEVRRTASERALRHATRCRGLFGGHYEHFTMGRLEERCFAAGGAIRA